MRFLRALVAIPAFIVFPVAFLVSVDAMLLGSQVPDALENAMVEFFDTEDGERMLRDDVSEMLLAEPELADWQDEIPALAAELAANEKFRGEAINYSGDFADYLAGDLDDPPTIDLLASLAELRDELDPDLYNVLSEKATVTPNGEDLQGAFNFQRIVDFGAQAAFVAALGLVLLAGSSQSARVVLGSLTFVMGPLLILQAVVIQVLRASVDDPSATIFVSKIANDLLMLTAALGGLVVVTFVLFLKWPQSERPSSVHTPEDFPQDAIYRGKVA